MPVPEPRKVQFEVRKLKPSPVILNVPALSFTTWLAGQPSNADWIAAVSSPPLGESVR